MNAMMVTSQSVHANCVVVGDSGILIRGPSGSGKSTVSRRLIDLARNLGYYSEIVGDDRILLRSHDTRIVASGHPLINGRLEVRGLGIVRSNFESRAVIRLLVDCEPVLGVRAPVVLETTGELFGIFLRRITVTPDTADHVLVALGLRDMVI
jgi:serine kinase of HPr protein (carbohydrate metabolism regulator)